MEQFVKDIIKAGLREHLKSRIDKGGVDKQLDEFIKLLGESRDGSDSISFSFPIVVDTAFVDLVIGIIEATKRAQWR
jgi:hypothetical protein